MSRILGGLPAGQRRMAVELAKYREEGIKTAKDQERVNELLDDMAPAAQDAAEQMARLNGQSKALKDSQKDLEKSLDDLPDSVETAARALLGLRKGWEEVQQKVQVRMFREFADDIAPAAKQLLPLAQRNLSKLSGTLGKVIHDSIMWARSPLFSNQLDKVTSASAGHLEDAGEAGQHFGRALMAVTVAAIPLANRISGAVVRAAEWVDQATRGGDAADRMARFFDRAGDRAAVLWDILKNTAKGVYGVFVGSREAGDSLLAGVQRQAERFAKWASSDRGLTAIRSYYNDALPAARAVAGLIGDIIQSLDRLSATAASKRW